MPTPADPPDPDDGPVDDDLAVELLVDEPDEDDEDGPPSAEALLCALARSEREGDRGPVPIGVFVAYLLAGAIDQATRRPAWTGGADGQWGMSGAARVAERVRAQIRQAYAGSPFAPLVMELDALREESPQRPGAGYTAAVTQLMEEEKGGAVLYITLGPYTCLVLSLLLRQLARWGRATAGLEPAGDVIRMLAGQLETGLRMSLGATFLPLLDRDPDPGADPELAAAVDAATAMLDAPGPRCPGCDQPPRLLLAGDAQAFCGTDGCEVFIWNPQQSAQDFWAEAKRGEVGLIELRREGVED